MVRNSRLSEGQRSGPRPYVPPSIRSGAAEEDPTERLLAIEQETRARGLQQGYQEGLALAREEAEARQRGIVASIEALAGLRREVVRRAEQDLLRLAIQIAEAVVREKVASDSSVAVRALEEALSEMPRTESFTVRCNPAEADALTAALGGSGGSGGTPAFIVRPDAAIGLGGCYVDSAAGAIDVRVETQLRVLEHELVARS